MRNISLKMMRAGLAVMAVGVGLVVGGCPGTPKDAGKATVTLPTTRGAMDVLWRVQLGRREGNFVRMDLPVVVKGMRVVIGKAMEGKQWNGAMGVYTTRVFRGGVEGPMVAQLTGSAKTGTDAGTYLVPLAGQEIAGGGGVSFEVTEPMPVYLKVTVSPGQEAGEYEFPISLVMPGASAGQSNGPLGLMVDVSEVAIPTEPRILGVMTTTTDDLAKIYPKTFGTIIGAYLDRNDADDAGAVAQLDALEVAAEREGVALFVEDFMPRVKVDNVGAVTLDWDAYDRVMQPYMDGTAFADHVPLQVWLAPVPPGRLRDSPAQLRQYVAACAEHFVAKGWVATPAFMHPALVGQSDDVDPKLRNEISEVLKLHMTRDMLAVTTPDAVVPQARLWVVDDSDPRLPPAGALGTESSVRLWPWVCAARGVKGFVWRGAVARSEDLKNGGDGQAGARALLIVDGQDGGKTRDVCATLRMAWLHEGLNDTALLGLLERRSDARVVNEVLAGVVGRTGLKGTGPWVEETGKPDLPTPSSGFLYAGWLSGREHWAAVPGMLEKLVVANDPGKTVTISPNDPVYIAAQLWLATAHQPVARVAGYRFELRGEGDARVLETEAELLVENPVDAAVQMVGRFASLPGDFEVVPAIHQPPGRRVSQVGGYGLSRIIFPVAGHLDSLWGAAQSGTLEIQEQNGGATLRLPVGIPVFRMKSTDAPPKIDGKGSDWPGTGGTKRRPYSAMIVGKRYLSRPDLVSGTVRQDEEPAEVKWTFDDQWLYVLVRCPQGVVSDERNSEWPLQDQRWWGTDGVQIQLASLGTMPAGAGGEAGGKVIDVAFKPGGVMLTRMATLKGSEPLQWVEGPQGVKYGMSVEKEDGRVKGYLVEAAIPRKWFEAKETAWRVNVLRHRAHDLASMSWSGPVVNDEDVAMMGLLIGSD